MPSRFRTAATLALALSTITCLRAQSSDSGSSPPASQPRSSSPAAGASPTGGAPRATQSTSSAGTSVASSPSGTANAGTVASSAPAANAATVTTQASSLPSAASVSSETSGNTNPAMTPATAPGTVNSPQTAVTGTINDPNATLQPAAPHRATETGVTAPVAVAPTEHEATDPALLGLYLLDGALHHVGGHVEQDALDHFLEIAALHGS